MLDFTGEFQKNPEKAHRKREKKTVKIYKKALMKSVT